MAAQPVDEIEGEVIGDETHGEPCGLVAGRPFVDVVAGTTLPARRSGSGSGSIGVGVGVGVGVVVVAVSFAFAAAALRAVPRARGLEETASGGVPARGTVLARGAA